MARLPGGGSVRESTIIKHALNHALLSHALLSHAGDLPNALMQPPDIRSLPFDGLIMINHQRSHLKSPNTCWGELGLFRREIESHITLVLQFVACDASWTRRIEWAPCIQHHHEAHPTGYLYFAKSDFWGVEKWDNVYGWCLEEQNYMLDVFSRFPSRYYTQFLYLLTAFYQPN